MAIVETAENVLFKAEDSNLIRRFESFDDERKTIANAIYKLRHYYIKKFNNNDNTEHLENRIYKAIQLLRLNRVTLLYASNPEAKKAQVLGLKRQRVEPKNLLIDRSLRQIRLNKLIMHLKVTFTFFHNLKKIYLKIQLY